LISLQAINNPVLKEILVSSNISKAASVLVYCIVTPVLEETVYSAAHLSGENSLQLFIIGCMLGCSNYWTGNLRSPILHSLYNAMTLMITFLS
ncbi:unnamed protein product, partial [Prunus brigantina]